MLINGAASPRYLPVFSSLELHLLMSQISLSRGLICSSLWLAFSYKILQLFFLELNSWYINKTWPLPTCYIWHSIQCPSGSYCTDIPKILPRLKVTSMCKVELTNFFVSLFNCWFFLTYTKPLWYQKLFAFKTLSLNIKKWVCNLLKSCNWEFISRT